MREHEGKAPASYIERVLYGSEKGRDVGHTYSHLLGEVVEYRAGDRLIPPGPGEGRCGAVMPQVQCEQHHPVKSSPSAQIKRL